MLKTYVFLKAFDAFGFSELSGECSWSSLRASWRLLELYGRHLWRLAASFGDLGLAWMLQETPGAPKDRLKEPQGEPPGEPPRAPQEPLGAGSQEGAFDMVFSGRPAPFLMCKTALGALRKPIERP